MVILFVISMFTSVMLQMFILTYICSEQMFTAEVFICEFSLLHLYSTFVGYYNLVI